VSVTQRKLMMMMMMHFLIGWLIGRWIDWWFDWWIGWLSDWSVGWLIDNSLSLYRLLCSGKSLSITQPRLYNQHGLVQPPLEVSFGKIGAVRLVGYRGTSLIRDRPPPPQGHYRA
jgi:hypothetical protein